MNRLVATKLDFGTEYPELATVSDRFDNSSARYAINLQNWGEKGYVPSVGFTIGYTNKEILLKYWVLENYFLARCTGPNQKVYEDSCVEFFVSPSDDGIYYNFEFNAIGACLLGCGAQRSDNIHLDPQIISKIRINPSLGFEPVIEEIKGVTKWSLTVAIPFEVFTMHKICELKGKLFKGNFYKCGDKLSAPHYLTWAPIATERPDFHRPEFFGEIEFC